MADIHEDHRDSIQSHLKHSTNIFPESTINEHNPKYQIINEVQIIKNFPTNPKRSNYL